MPKLVPTISVEPEEGSLLSKIVTSGDIDNLLKPYKQEITADVEIIGRIVNSKKNQVVVSEVRAAREALPRLREKINALPESEDRQKANGKLDEAELLIGEIHEFKKQLEG